MEFKLNIILENISINIDNDTIYYDIKFLFPNSILFIRLLVII